MKSIKRIHNVSAKKQCAFTLESDHQKNDLIAKSHTRKKEIFDFSYQDRHRENDESIIVRRIAQSLQDEEM